MEGTYTLPLLTVFQAGLEEEDIVQKAESHLCVEGKGDTADIKAVCDTT